jgi:anti-anti-sigma regulatory factor
MPAKHLEATVRQEPGVAVIDLTGEINGFVEDYINSTGIALIVSLLARARASKRRLLACNLSEHYVEIFEITRLSDFISVLPDEESAIAEASVS